MSRVCWEPALKGARPHTGWTRSAWTCRGDREAPFISAGHGAGLAMAPPARKPRQHPRVNRHFQLLPQEPQVPSAPSCALWLWTELGNATYAPLSSKPAARMGLAALLHGRTAETRPNCSLGALGGELMYFRETGNVAVPGPGPPSSQQTPSLAIPELGAGRAWAGCARLPGPLQSRAEAKAPVQIQTSLCRKQPRVPQPGWGFGDRERDIPPSSSPHSGPSRVAFQHPQTPPRCCGAFPQPCASSQGLDKHLLP